MNTRKLVKEAKKGDKEALIQLIMDKKEEYYKLSYVYMKNKEDALDAMEDMILALYENIQSLKKENAFYTWSKTILVNCCKTILKGKKRLIPFADVNIEVSEDKRIEKDRKIILEEYMKKLNKKHEEVIKLRYFLDLDYKSISKILKIPVGTVKSRIAIGLKRLRESFGGERFE